MLLPDLTYPAILVFVPRDLGLMRSLAEVFLPIVTLSDLDLSLPQVTRGQIEEKKFLQVRFLQLSGTLNRWQTIPRQISNLVNYFKGHVFFSEA